MKSAKYLPIVFILFFLSIQINSNAQEQRTYRAHEEIELQDGMKVEILRSRGEGETEELDVIYYTTKRQLGKRMWQKASVLRAEEKAAIEARRAQALDARNAQKKKPASIDPVKTSVAKTASETLHKIDSSATAFKNKIESAPEEKRTPVTSEPVTAKKPETSTPAKVAPDNTTVVKQKSTDKKEKIVAKTKSLNATNSPETKNISPIDSAITKISLPPATSSNDAVDSVPNTETPVSKPNNSMTKIEAPKNKEVATNKTGNHKSTDTKKTSVIDSAITKVNVPTTTSANNVEDLPNTTNPASSSNNSITKVEAPKNTQTEKNKSISPDIKSSTTQPAAQTPSQPLAKKPIETPAKEPAQTKIDSLAVARNEAETVPVEQQQSIENAQGTTELLTKASDVKLTTGAKIEANVGGRWKPGTVVETESGLLYKIHFDGESSDSDEWMTLSQLRKSSSPTLITNAGETKEDKNPASAKGLKTSSKPAAQVSCTFKAPGNPVIESESFSLNLAKRKIYDAYVSNGKKAATPPAKVGVTFLAVNALEPFVNNFTMLSNGSTQYKYADAPPGAFVYTVRSQHVECEQFGNGIKRKMVDANYGCFRNKEGKWTCSVIGSPDEKEIE